MASRLPLFVTCALLCCGAGAAELGEPRISSYIGQPLALEVELTALAAPAVPVQASLAHPNVYRGANIGMPSVLSTLAMSVTQRDGRQFLRVTSGAPVEASRLHLYLELLDGSARDVRLVTLSIAPNPNPAPAPAPAAVVLKAAPPQVVEAPRAALAPPKPLAAVKPAVPRPPRPVEPAKPVVARAAPALASAALPPPLVKPLPAPLPAPSPTSLPAPESAASPLSAAPAAACAPLSSLDRATVCAALDYKNAQLREQISALESKVRVLQVALGANPSAVVQHETGAVANPRPSRKRAPAAPAPAPDAPLPWGWISIGLLAVLVLVGGALLVVRRRKRAGPIQPMPGLPLMQRLRQRFARNKKAPQQVEPQLDEAAK